MAAGVASEKQSQFRAEGTGSGPAKGLCRRWDRLYEQSQSARSDRDRRRSAGSPAEVSLGLFAPNKPNLPRGDFKDKCCSEKELRRIRRGNGPGKTKPIPRGRRWIRTDKGPVPAAGPVVQTNPIRPRDGDRHRPAKSPTKVSLGSFAPNKPNFPVAEGQTVVPVRPETPYGVTTNQAVAPNEANLWVRR